MYNTIDYLKRGLIFVNNALRPSHKKLATLMLYGTNLCNSRCLHCHIWEKKPKVHLPKEKIIEVMKSKCISQYTKIGLEGGEFLLHPRAKEILAWFSKNHPNFDIFSNGLTPAALLKVIKETPPKRLYISLDGTKETYKKMRGVDGYDKVIETIEKCKNLVPISLIFTLSPYNNFNDLDHVLKIAQKNKIDLRIGIYNNIHFFETSKDAPEEKFDEKSEFKKNLINRINETAENYDFLLLYREWKKKDLKLNCYSILDSLVIHPNGDVPICQNLGVMLGNIYDSSLDELFNSAKSQMVQRKYSKCNECWVSFHRKYDIILLKNLEKMLPKKLIELFYGRYHWTKDKSLTYSDALKKLQEN